MKHAALVALVVTGITGRAAADEIVASEPVHRTPFDQGRMNLSIGGGSTNNLGARYFGIGAGFGYFVLDGLELGISGLYEFGDGPSISKLSPSIRYVAQPLVGKSPLVPYVGTFYNHWFVGGGIADVDTVGARGGLAYVSGAAVLGLGVVYERTISACTSDCSDVYPDFVISVAL